MKGQAFVIPETMIDILKNLIVIGFFLGLFLTFAVYNIRINDVVNKRIAFDIVNVMIGNKCLIYEDDGGNFYRSIFDKEKLDRGDICLDLKNFEVEITDFEKTWNFGSSQRKDKFVVPVTIHEGGEFKFGRMVVSY